MAKRKTYDDSAAEQDSEEVSSLDESSSEDEYDEIRQEFEFFDPQTPWDFEGFKRLLRQLFDADATSFHLGAIADLILAQPLLGSTIKTEGNESDPHAFMTILNLKEHEGKPVIKELTNYISHRAGTNPQLAPLQPLLRSGSGKKVGLILTERWVNIATELIPPMYRMLLEEISWAVAEREPYTFSHYLIMSKTYLAIPSLLNEETNRPKKKMKPKATKGIDEGHTMYYFHPEDEVLERHATLFGGFDYVKPSAEGESDSKSTFHDFGIKQRGHLILIEAAKFEAAVKEMEAEFATQSSIAAATIDKS
ncbi:MAG: hypothetical protein L6R35_005197 [Caloplaca aegaea]|nr:MAG: hypothetical protein LQ341_002114 [Variospora aurantia]KAI4283351.1 MAG: hypothetical protein L6R35_005197 [Caloplaca aegaea]